MSWLIKLRALQEIACNYIWLRPLVEQWPDEVPGALVLTDVMLYLSDLIERIFL